MSATRLKVCEDAAEPAFERHGGEQVPVVPLQLDPAAYFPDHNNAEKHALRARGVMPSENAGVTPRSLSELGDHVGVQ